MKIKNHSVRRAIYGFAALALAVAALVPGLSGRASAAQVTTRSIKMSSSTAGAAASYQVVFTPGTSGTVGGIVVDFCDNTPIIGDTSCTVPTGFTVTGTPAVTVNGGMGSGWTFSSANSGQVLFLSNSTPQSLSTGTPVDFTITSVTNPNTANHSFYARVLTFNTSANMSSQYTVSTTTRASSFANMVDYGGIALSTATPINITARVMESLAFCVYKTTCGDDPSMTLGHGGNTILDNTAIDTGTAKFSVSTNAQTGADIRWKGDTLKSGSNSIAAAGAGTSTTPVTFTTGAGNTAAFGAAVPSGTLGTSTTASTYYDGNGTTTFNLFAANVTGTYGDIIAQISGPVNSSVTSVVFGAVASNTTPAGIYTATEQLIATGKF